MLRKRILAGVALATAATTAVFASLGGGVNPTPATEDVRYSEGSLTMDATLSHRAISRDGATTIYARVDVNAGVVEHSTRPSMDVALLFDRSASMSGEKLAAAKDAAHALIARMGSNDRLALVSFDSSGTIDRPLTVLDVDGRARLDQAVQDLRLGGGTNIGDAYDQGALALKGGRDEAAKVMFLISDGQPTVGEQRLDVLRTRATRGLQDDNVTLTTLGIGDGFDERVMGGMAVAGGGNFYYAASPATLERDLNAEWEGLSSAAARRITVSLTPAPGVTITRVHGFSTRVEGESTFVYFDAMFAKSSRILVVELQADGHKVEGADLVRVDLMYDDVTLEPARRQSVDRSLSAEIVDRALGVDDVRPVVLSRVRRVTTAAVVEAADQLWAAGDVKEAQRIISAARIENAAHIARFGATEELQMAQQQLAASGDQMRSMNVREKRSIRIRKKRMLDTIEIIAGDR